MIKIKNFEIKKKYKKENAIKKKMKVKLIHMFIITH